MLIYSGCKFTIPQIYNYVQQYIPPFCTPVSEKPLVEDSRHLDILAKLAEQRVLHVCCRPKLRGGIKGIELLV